MTGSTDWGRRAPAFPILLAQTPPVASKLLQLLPLRSSSRIQPRAEDVELAWPAQQGGPSRPRPLARAGPWQRGARALAVDSAPGFASQLSPSPSRALQSVQGGGGFPSRPAPARWPPAAGASPPRPSACSARRGPCLQSAAASPPPLAASLPPSAPSRLLRPLPPSEPPLPPSETPLPPFETPLRPFEPPLPLSSQPPLAARPPGPAAPYPPHADAPLPLARSPPQCVAVDPRHDSCAPFPPSPSGTRRTCVASALELVRRAATAPLSASAQPEAEWLQSGCPP
mmetsp:Transcript_83063/g.243544  ORF Transcript_83063/g.243544 Transcript_83063/m.243544 type:complete len:285 (-) Transcript_83063:1064-1918(-)